AAADFRNLDVLIAAASSGDTLNGRDVGASWTLEGANGGRYEEGTSSLAFTGFEIVSGGIGADRFVLGDAVHAGDFVLSGGAGDDAIEIEGGFEVGGILDVRAVEAIRN